MKFFKALVPHICPVLADVGKANLIAVLILVAVAPPLSLPGLARQGGGVASPTTDYRHPITDPAQQPAASATQAMYNAAATSAEAKFRHIEENSRRNPPDQRPTVLTEREINAYLASGRVQLPTGVRSARFTGRSGVVNATARVDFDAITAQSKSSNPLLSLFSGVHDVHARAQASASGHQARVHIESIDIDGVTVPRIALQFFLDHYVRPKHPEVGMDSVFALPARIDTATVGDHQLVLTQK